MFVSTNANGLQLNSQSEPIKLEVSSLEDPDIPFEDFVFTNCYVGYNARVYNDNGTYMLEFESARIYHFANAAKMME